jgi:exonuclease III
VMSYLTLMDDSTPLKICSYNCRGYNRSKQRFILKLLADYFVLFLQEHWLSDNQCHQFSNELSTECSYASVAGFEGSEVLKGRPYGGCAILWRSKILNDVVRLDINSRRIVAIKCLVGGNKLVLINVYLPCDTDDTLEEFSSELSICENLINDHDDHEVIIGGDFNIDLSRVSSNTMRLYNLCKGEQIQNYKLRLTCCLS